MNKHELTLLIFTMALLIGLIAAIVFVCTYHGRVYRSLKQPTITKGVIDNIHVIHVPSHNECSPGGDYYQITCSYNDHLGFRHTFTFDWRQNIGGVGDSLELYYDAQNPDKCIMTCQLHYGKNLWWKILLFLAVLIGLAAFITIKFGNY